MIYSILFLALAALFAWFWRAKYVPAEVAQNAAAIKANGSADNLQRGFHGREVWSRVWPGLACCVVPALPLSFGGGVGGGVLGFGSMAALLLAIFIYDFTPKLNLARIANGDAWLKTKWYASPASKSWPDAGAWKEARGDKALMFTQEEEQLYANATMKNTIIRTACLCLLAAALLGGAALVVASRANL